MAEKPSWTIQVGSCSETELVHIISQLRGSEHLTVQLEAQRELVERLRKRRGLDTGQIVGILAAGAGKAELKEIAREWAITLGVSEREFMRLASGK